MKQLITVLIFVNVIGFLSLCARAAEVPRTLAIELLAKTTYSDDLPPVFPAELKKLEGQRVRISGFMVPYNEAEKFTQLVLVDTPGGCFFCSPPLPTSAVFVRRPAADPPLKYSNDTISFEGTLHLWNSEMKEDDNAQGFFFTIDDARVSPSNHGLSSILPWMKKKARGE